MGEKRFHAQMISTIGTGVLMLLVVFFGDGPDWLYAVEGGLGAIALALFLTIAIRPT